MLFVYVLSRIFFISFFSNFFSLQLFFSSSATDCFKVLLIRLFRLLALDTRDYSSCIVLTLRCISGYFCLWHGKTRYQGNQVSGDRIACASGKTFTIAGSMKSPWKQRAHLFLVFWTMFTMLCLSRPGMFLYLLCVQRCVLSRSGARLGSLWIWSESSQSFC